MRTKNEQQRNNKNPPYSKSIKTNIGRIFLKLIKKHIATSGKMKELFNKNKSELQL